MASQYPLPPPSTWVNDLVLMFGWGVTTMTMGWTQDLRGLIVCRIFLGVFEAGLLPGCIYIVSMWYKRDEGEVFSGGS